MLPISTSLKCCRLRDGSVIASAGAIIKYFRVRGEQQVPSLFALCKVLFPHYLPNMLILVLVMSLSACLVIDLWQVYRGKNI